MKDLDDVMSKPDASGRLCPGSALRPTKIGCEKERLVDSNTWSGLGDAGVAQWTPEPLNS